MNNNLRIKWYSNIVLEVKNNRSNRSNKEAINNIAVSVKIA